MRELVCADHLQRSIRGGGADADPAVAGYRNDVIVVNVVPEQSVSTRGVPRPVRVTRADAIVEIESRTAANRPIHLQLPYRIICADADVATQMIDIGPGRLPNAQ